MSTQTYDLFCIGNPLLDIQVVKGESLLEKYKLKANDAVLASDEQLPIYDDIVKNHEVTYVAGGASQNAARGAAYCLPPNSVVFTGCVGDDELSEQLKAANRREGLKDVYLVKKGEQTGACAVVITGHHRSLVTTLRAAEKFEQSHLSSPEVAPLISAAKFFYVEGYFLTHGTESVVEVAKNASLAGKTFALNLSAPFIPQFFQAQVQQVMPYVDVLFCNEAEAEAWATAIGHPAATDLPAVAKAIAALPKSNPSRPRLVVITHGSEPTIVINGASADVKEYPVHVLKETDIVDTNGAGDAFAGAFMAALVAGKDLDAAVAAGQKLAASCIQESGPQFKWPKVQIFE